MLVFPRWPRHTFQTNKPSLKKAPTPLIPFTPCYGRGDQDANCCLNALLAGTPILYRDTFSNMNYVARCVFELVLTAKSAFLLSSMCCGVMVAATLAGALATNSAASAVVMCSITTFSSGTSSSKGICNNKTTSSSRSSSRSSSGAERQQQER